MIKCILSFQNSGMMSACLFIEHMQQESTVTQSCKLLKENQIERSPESMTYENHIIFRIGVYNMLLYTCVNMSGCKTGLTR